mmetsp:Transcript_51707/g.133366  ORF Transcript_51707/g.133366 Transcript_51707/m.133366 type:complete len:256 (-) Transcript_51707:211-978(-)
MQPDSMPTTTQLERSISNPSTEAPNNPNAEYEMKLQEQIAQNLRRQRRGSKGSVQSQQKRRSCVVIQLQCGMALLITVLIWVLYTAIRLSPHRRSAVTSHEKDGDHAYPWPTFVNHVLTAVVLLSPLFTLVSTLPFTMEKRCGPIWNMIVVGNLLVINAMSWTVYALSACQMHETCDFAWPLIVTGVTVAVGAGTSVIAYLTSPPSEAKQRHRSSSQSSANPARASSQWSSSTVSVGSTSPAGRGFVDVEAPVAV